MFVKLLRNIVFVPVLLFATMVYGQRERVDLQVNYRVNKTYVEPTYMGNTALLNDIFEFFERLESDTTVRIVNVAFCGSASPEGSYQWNRKLSKGRLETLEKMIRSRVSILDSLVTKDEEYIPWNYLDKKVSESNMPHKREILDIIRGEHQIVDYPGNRHIDSRVLDLQRFNGGKEWRELFRKHFRSMRNARVIIITYKKLIDSVDPLVSTPTEVEMEYQFTLPELLPMASVTRVVPDEWIPKLYLKTNTLGLGLLISNLAVEADFAPHWSFTLPVYYSAWNYFVSTVKFRTFALQPEIRFWFNRKNDGFFTGAHCGYVYYNIATNGKYRTQDRDGKNPSLGGGISLGYRLPVSANQRLKMEFSVGAGIYPLDYDRFHNYHNGLVAYSNKKTYFGLDQASITLAYSFGLRKKGGKR